jgi:hypothetical protein
MPVHSAVVPACSSFAEVAELPPRPTQNAAELVSPTEQLAPGCFQVADTAVKDVPVTT